MNVPGASRPPRMASHRSASPPSSRCRCTVEPADNRNEALVVVVTVAAPRPKPVVRSQSRVHIGFWHAALFARAQPNRWQVRLRLRPLDEAFQQFLPLPAWQPGLGASALVVWPDHWLEMAGSFVRRVVRPRPRSRSRRRVCRRVFDGTSCSVSRLSVCVSGSVFRTGSCLCLCLSRGRDTSPPCVRRHAHGYEPTPFAPFCLQRTRASLISSWPAASSRLCELRATSTHRPPIVFPAVDAPRSQGPSAAEKTTRRAPTSATTTKQKKGKKKKEKRTLVDPGVRRGPVRSRRCASSMPVGRVGRASWPAPVLSPAVSAIAVT